MSNQEEIPFEVTGIDVSKLENVVYRNGKLTACCPACAASGGDTKAHHLVIYPGGKFGCVKYQGDKEHRRQIKKWVGRSERLDPVEHRNRRKARAKEQQESSRKSALVGAVKRARSNLLNCYHWNLASVISDSPLPVHHDEVGLSAKTFIGALFQPADVVWTGQVHDTGQPHHSNHWRTSAQWLARPEREVIGPCVSPATWRPNVYSRSNENVLSVPYLVLDFDGLDGIEPKNQQEKMDLIHAALAFTRFLREVCYWRLSAILLTGNKSTHVWFRCPPREALASLRTVHREFGVDHCLIGNPSQPCRLPGHPHPKSGNQSRVIWLQNASTLTPT